MYERLHQRFWSLLHTALTSNDNTTLLMLQANEVRIAFGPKRLFVILLDEKPAERIALQNWAKVLLEENPVPEIDIVVVAPSSEVDQTLSETEFQVPWTTRLSILTLNEEGVSHEITSHQTDALVTRILETSVRCDLSQKVLKLLVKAALQSTGDIVNFQKKLAAHMPVATYVLLGVISAFYIMQVLLGAEDYAPGLVRMGADSAELVAKGQYWRLLTSIFLHGGFLHIAMNGYVLYALGIFFNRLIGNARFLTLFFLSGAAGSLASVFISHSSLSVGASGALWGLFGLGGALIVKPSHFLPDAVRNNLRNITLLNLAINIAFSFAVPMIDKWAHFGGGIAGFLIGLAFVFEPSYRIKEKLHISLAALSSLVAFACVAINFAVEKPWILAQPLELSSQSIFDGAYSISVPSFLEKREETKNKVTFGDINFDPFVLVVLVQKLEVTPEELRLDLASKIETPIESKVVDGTPIFSTFVEKTRVKDWRWWLWRKGEVILVEIAAQDGLPKKFAENIGRIAESISSPLRI